MQCAESLRVQAYFDGELEALSSLEIERHLEHCAECRALLTDLEHVRIRLRRDVPLERAPVGLHERVRSTLDDEGQTPGSVIGPPRRRLAPFWVGVCSGIGGSALAAALALLWLMPALTNSVDGDLVGAHVRSLMPGHLIEVVSADRHTVKPWFAGHADVSPVVADFEPQGYRLLGGRADHLDWQRAAVVVYQHGKHTINVFAWATSARPRTDDATRNGYHLAFWKSGNLQYCAISDTGWDELHGLEDLLRDLSTRDDAQRRVRD